MFKRQLAAFLVRFAAAIAASLLVRLAAFYAIALWVIGAIAILLIIKMAILGMKWSLYHDQLNSPHYHYNMMSQATDGGEQISIRELTEETIGLAVWVTVLVLGGVATWYELAT